MRRDEHRFSLRIIGVRVNAPMHGFENRVACDAHKARLSVRVVMNGATRELARRILMTARFLFPHRGCEPFLLVSLHTLSVAKFSFNLRLTRCSSNFLHL